MPAMQPGSCSCPVPLILRPFWCSKWGGGWAMKYGNRACIIYRNFPGLAGWPEAGKGAGSVKLPTEYLSRKSCSLQANPPGVYGKEKTGRHNTRALIDCSCTIVSNGNLDRLWIYNCHRNSFERVADLIGFFLGFF